MSKIATAKMTAIAVHCFATAVALASPVHKPSSPTSIFSPVSTPAQSIYELSLFVLAITAGVFVLVFGLLAYAVIKFRERAHDDQREPPQVYGSSQVETAWTVIQF
jgi:cytochrome c oxidase subunit 2